MVASGHHWKTLVRSFFAEDVKGGKTDQQYSLICLLNAIFKIFTEVVTKRINVVANHMVYPSQATFMQGRNMLDEMVVLHETVHKMP